MQLDISQIWTAAGVLLGFQVTSFSWRISQEAQVAEKDEISWIPPADYLNLTSMLAIVCGVFIAPVLGAVNINVVQMWFGLGALLFVGHSFALAGHYELFNNKTKRTYRYFPPQEKVAIFGVLVLAISYIVLWYV